MGSLHTTDVMLRGAGKEVEQACMKATDDAASDGGFILSTGGRNTPDGNVRKLVEVCKSHGR